jgi:hypothetical protein
VALKGAFDLARVGLSRTICVSNFFGSAASALKLFLRHSIALPVMTTLAICHGFNVRYIVVCLEFSRKRSEEMKESQIAGIAVIKVE